MGGEHHASALAEEEREGSGITIEILQQHFHQPLVTVAEELGVSLTMIKRLCRKLGMPRWPYRQIDSINKSMEDLQDQLEGARTDAERERCIKMLQAALKKKRLITRGAAAGVDPNVRNALYLADTADVSEEDIFGNPDLMPKLSAALKTITKRKRVKGKPLVDLIATVQRDGSLPACVQPGTGASSVIGTNAAAATAVNTPTSSSLNSRRPAAGARRHHRPPALFDAMATSNEEYTANMEQAYGSVHRPESSASGSTSVSPALSNLALSSNNSSSSSTEEYARHGWGHSNGGGSGYGSQQYGRSGTPANARSVAGAVAADAAAGRDVYPQETVLASPASSCTTLVSGTSPVGDGRFSPGGSLSGGFSPAATKNSTPTSHIQQVKSESNGVSGGGVHTSFSSGPVMQLPPSARSSTGGGGHTWGQRQASPAGGGGQLRPQKRLSTTSSAASTDVESLDTSHLMDFDDDDDDDGVAPYFGHGYAGGEMGGVDGYRYASSAVSGGAGGGGGGSGGAGGAGAGGQPVSPEELQELEDALLMDSFGGVMDELLDGEEATTGAFPGMNSHSSFPDLQNVGASLPPLPRAGPGGTSGQRGTPRSASAGGAGSPHVSTSQAFGASPSHAGSASPVGAAVSATAGFPLAGSNSGPPRPGPRGMGRPRSQVPPRPYTPGKSSRGVSVPFLSHGLGGGISPRVGPSPRPPTPRPPTPGTPGGVRTAASPNGRRRGDEAFPEHFALPSPNEHGGNGRGGPSPKARRVGVRSFPERFPGSPQAALSPRVGFPQVSPRSGAVGGFSVGACSPLDGGGGSDRTYFPAPAANAAAAAFASSPLPASGSSRSHRRSSSSGWGSAPRHGGGGELGIDTAAGVGANMSAGFQSPGASQSWGVRLGENPKTASLPGASISGRHSNWGVASTGEVANAPLAPSPRGGGGPATTAGSGRAAQQHSTTEPQTAGRANHGHGVVRRRHSSPIPPLPTFPGAPSAAEWPGGDGASAAGKLKSDLMKTELVPDGGGGNFMDNFSSSVSRSTGQGWAPPPPPPSPMPEKDAWWPPPAGEMQQASGGVLSEASAVAVAAVAAAALPSSGVMSTFGDGCGDVNTQATTTTMPVDL